MTGIKSYWMTLKTNKKPFKYISVFFPNSIIFYRNGNDFNTSKIKILFNTTSINTHTKSQTETWLFPLKQNPKVGEENPIWWYSLKTCGSMLIYSFQSLASGKSECHGLTPVSLLTTNGSTAVCCLYSQSTENVEGTSLYHLCSIHSTPPTVAPSSSNFK